MASRPALGPRSGWWPVVSGRPGSALPSALSGQGDGSHASQGPLPPSMRLPWPPAARTTPDGRARGRPPEPQGAPAPEDGRTAPHAPPASLASQRASERARGRRCPLGSQASRSFAPLGGLRKKRASPWALAPVSRVPSRSSSRRSALPNGLHVKSFGLATQPRGVRAARSEQDLDTLVSGAGPLSLARSAPRCERS